MRSLVDVVDLSVRSSCADRVFELLDAKADYPEGDDGVVLPVGSIPNVAVRGLNFAYPDDPDTMVLKDVSLELPAGSTMGICKTGSGPCWGVVSMYTRTWHGGCGRYRYLWLDIYGWRAKLSTVPQRPFLFSDSVERTLR